jgi:hypothetical protein
MPLVHSEARGAAGAGAGEPAAERAGRNTVGWKLGLAVPLEPRPVEAAATELPDGVRLAAATAVTGEWPDLGSTRGMTGGGAVSRPRSDDAQSLLGPM